MQNRIRESRRRVGISQKQLAMLAGIPITTLSDVERGLHIPGVDVALRIADALGCSVESLFKLEISIHTPHKGRDTI